MGLVPRNPCMDTIGTQYPHVLCPCATTHQESQSLSTRGLHTDRVLPHPMYPNSQRSHTAHTPTPLGTCALSPRRPMLPGSSRYRPCVPVTPVQRPSPNNPARGHSHHSPQRRQHFQALRTPTLPRDHLRPSSACDSTPPSGTLTPHSQHLGNQPSTLRSSYQPCTPTQ